MLARHPKALILLSLSVLVGVSLLTSVAGATQSAWAQVGDEMEIDLPAGFGSFKDVRKDRPGVQVNVRVLRNASAGKLRFAAGDGVVAEAADGGFKAKDSLGAGHRAVAWGDDGSGKARLWTPGIRLRTHLALDRPGASVWQGARPDDSARGAVLDLDPGRRQAGRKHRRQPGQRVRLRRPQGSRPRRARRDRRRRQDRRAEEAADRTRSLPVRQRRLRLRHERQGQSQALDTRARRQEHGARRDELRALQACLPAGDDHRHQEAGPGR